MKTYTIYNVTEDQLKEIIKQNPELLKEKKGRWRAERGSKYWTIDTYGGTHSYGGTYFYVEDGDTADNKFYNMGNYYKTEEEAQKAKEKQLAVMRVSDAIMDYNDWEEVDWSNSNQYKHYIYYDYANNKFDIGSVLFCTGYCVLPYSKEALTEDFINTHKNDLKLIFDVK